QWKSKVRRPGDGARPVRFWRLQHAIGRQPVAARCIECGRVAGRGSIVGIDRGSEIARGNTNQHRQLFNRVSLMWRHVGSDGALESIYLEQAAVEDRVGDAVRPREMDVARKTFPGLVDETRAFVEETTPVLVDDNAVGVDQHDRSGMPAARIDRLDMHAVPVAGGRRALVHRHADAVTGIEARSRRDQFQGLGGGPEMLSHHRDVALKTAGSEDHGIGVDRTDVPAAGSYLDAADAALSHPEPDREGFVAKFYSSF